MVDALAKVLETEGGLILLLLLSPTIALGIIGFLYFKSMGTTVVTKPVPPPTIDYDALSSMRKEQRAMAAAIHKLSERVARMEATLEERRAT
jgi:hypothetical protein